VLARCETEVRGMPEIGDRVWRLARIAEEETLLAVR
jgi:hypothetical protein